MKNNVSFSVTMMLAAGLMTNLFCAGPAHAIPAFTRANKVECSTCHTIFPELNEYGEAFLKNAYVYFGKGKKKAAEKPKAAPATVETKHTASPVGGSVVKGAGDADLLSKLKVGTMISSNAPATSAGSSQNAEPENSQAAAASGDAKQEGIALSGVPEHLPISFTANLHGTYNSKAVNEFDLSAQSLKLNAGGNFKEQAGFFGTYFLYTEQPPLDIANTSTIPTNTKSDIGELFVVWRHALETPVNIKVGRFQPKLGLWKTNNRLSTTNSYATYAYTVGSSLFKAEQSQDAVEANMIFANRLFMAGGVVNRKNQNTKEWYVHTSVKVGGADYLANEPEIDLNKEESVFDYLTLTVGGYGYVGKNGNSPLITAGVPQNWNDYYRAGVDIDLLYKIYRLKLSGVIGNDDSPELSSKPPVKTYVAAIEGEYTIQQNLIASLRFEYQDDAYNMVRRYIPTLAYNPIENLKVVAEYKHESGFAYKTHAEVDNKIGTLGVTFSF